MRDFLIAWRNLLRHRRRTLTTLSALIIGLAGLVVFQGFLGEEMRNFRDSTILGGIGHIEVAGGEGYFGDGAFDPYAYILGNAKALETKLERDPRVACVFPSTGITAVAGKGKKATTLLVAGYPPERMYFAPPAGIVRQPRDRFSLGTLVAGSPIEPGARDRIVLGETAARVLGARPGEIVTLMAILPDGGLAGRDFRVAAVYRSAGLDKMFAYTDYETAKAFTGISGPPVLDVIAKNIAAVPAIVGSLPAGTAYRTWDRLATLYVQVDRMLMSFLDVIRAIILLVTLFILANSMSRAVLERMREWGTLRAIGTKRRDVLFIVLLEGCLQGAAGALIGVGLGFAISGAIDLAGGLHVREGTELFLVTVRPGLDAVWRNAIPAISTAGIAAILPGLRTVRLPLARCLRES
ncbi:MAG: ABC transporter permease [Rectinemataceae bacterium]